MPQEPTFPDHIAHKPVLAAHYFDHDPWYAGDTDAQFISLGWSQWDPRELSVKVLRRSDKRWSRQSEELPLPRAVDLTILIALALAEGDALVQLPAGTLQNQTAALPIAHGSSKDRKAAAQELRNDDVLKTRLQVLHDALLELRVRNLI